MSTSMEQEPIVFSDDQVASASSSLNMFDRSLAECGACSGTFKFQDTLSNYSSDTRPFLYVDESIDLNVLYKVMISGWKLHTPNIVIPILSGITNHKPFKNLKMVETLRNGIKNTANASEVWFTTNGIDAGLPQLIGAAFREDTALRRADDVWIQQVGRPVKDRKALTLIGIVCDNEIEDIISRIMAKDKAKTDIKIYTGKRDKYSLNSDHTHFIIIREQPIGMNSSNDVENKLPTIESGGEKLIDLANSATNRFRDRFENFLHREVVRQATPLPSPPTTNTQTGKSKSFDEIGSPMVCTLVRGTPGTIEMLYKKIHHEVPAVILKGTGSAADIIAFAYDEINAKNSKNYEDENLKIELARRLLDEYPTLKDNNVKRNEIRDHIIAIVKKADQSKQKFLTFVDVNSTTASLNDFHKFILSAYLQSKKTIIQDKVNVQLQLSLLRLTLDWNLADLARSEIFQRDDYNGYTIPNSLFEQALLGENLEAFVDLFLERDFVLHRYLNSDRLLRLFNQAKDRDFFTVTSLEGILGLSGDDDTVPEKFIERDLNDIIRRLTGIKYVFSKNEMKCNAMGIYFGQKTNKNFHWQQVQAEKKALRHLVIYAVLMNRHDLAKILWKRSPEPIPLALICSMMFNRLAAYCHESYQQVLIEKQAKEFSDFAIGVLDKSLKEDEIRTFEMLNMIYPDWNNMTVVQLAYNSDNKEFMADSVLQKWVTRKLYGEITPRELSWGLFKCSDDLKITISACLIFPMWFWISFSPIGQAPSRSKKDNDLPGGSTIDLQLDEQLRNYIDEVDVHEGRSCFPRLSSCSRRAQQRSTNEKTKSCFQKINILWSAPITKFYTNFVAYNLFLIFFTLAVMWPSCGNLFLDCLVWFWAASIAFENIRIGYGKYCSQNTLPLKGVIFEIIMQVTFLALYLGVRIIGLWNVGTCHILQAKAILGLGLIYYYYRILFIFFPISATLGQMMIRLQYMITGDFYTFLRLFVVFMISSGVAITAVLYPHHPLGWELFSKAIIFRGLMALFTTDMSALKNAGEQCTINATTETERKYACLRLSDSHSFQYNNMYAYQRYGISSPFCNQTSWIAWFLLIQYFFLAKRFLISLLTALFSLTGARVLRQAEKIWLYNRYAILVEYAQRPCLPPPLIVISYTIGLILNGYRQSILRLKKYSDKKIDTRRARAQTRAGIAGSMTRVAIPVVAVADPTAASNDPRLNTKPLSVSSSTTNNDRWSLGRLLNCKPCQKVIQNEATKSNNAEEYWEDSEANVYWKYKAKEYFAKSQESEKGQDKSSSSVNIQKDIDVLRKSLQQISDRVVTLEKMMIHSHHLLEKICATMPQEDKSLPESLKKFVHIYSRVSPYVYTNDARFPVTDKFVPWETPFELYDPTLITLPKEHICFSAKDQPFVEPNLLKLNSGRPDSSEAIEPAVTSGVTSDSNIPVSEYKWNQIVEWQLSDDKKMIVDRTTWITLPNDKTPTVYQLDTQLLVPLNPLGRTGVRGRGALIRWGPNKSIMAIITRWKKLDNQFVTVEGKRILEALFFTDKNTKDSKLPEAKIVGEEAPYSTVCRNFNELAFQDENYEHSLSFQERDMIEYFQSFARSEEVPDRRTEFEPHMVYRGYIDDVRNTDNAWVETEIWNFHYGSIIAFPHLRTDGTVLWKNVTYNLRGVSLQTSILREIARIHDAYFE